MPRGNIEVLEITKVADVIVFLSDLANKNEVLDAGNGMYSTCRNIFAQIGALDDFDPANPKEMAKILEALPPEVVEGEIEELLKKEAEVEEQIPAVEETRAESRALNKQDLKVLLEELEKHELKNEANSREAVERFIRQLKENVPQLKTVADNEVGRIVVEVARVEERLEETGQLKEESKKISGKIVEVAETSETLKDSREEITAVLKEIKIDSKELREEILKTTVLETAQKIVEEKVSETVNRLAQELADYEPTVRQKEEIEELVRERIEIKLEDPTRAIDEQEILVTKEGGKAMTETGENLTEKIAEVLGEKAIKKEIQIEVAVRNVELGLEKSLFVDKPNQDSPVDIIRAEKLETEVSERMVKTGATEEEANSVAVMIRNLSFPENEISDSWSELTATKKLEENGYHGGDNSRFAKQAGVMRNLIRSPVKIGENVNKVLAAGDKLGGIKGFEQLKTVAKTLKDNPALMKSLQLIQNVTRVQGAIGNFVGGITNPIGYILKIPALQEFGVQLATRFGGEMAGNMATQLANFGLEGGIKNIVGQLFTKGTVKVGEKIAADLAADAVVTGAGVSTGPPGWLVILAKLAIQAVVSIGKKVLGAVKNAVTGVLDGLNLNTPEVKQFFQDNLGKGVGGLVYWGGMAAMFLLAIPAAIATISVALIGIVTPAVLGGLALMQISTAQTVSSLVPPKGSGSGSPVGTPPPGSWVPADPIYDDKCVNSPAYCVVAYLLGNGVVIVNRSNVDAVAGLINKWQNAPANFNKADFNTQMVSSAYAFDAFQCVGFAVGINPTLGGSSWGNDPNSWQAMIAHGSAECPRIDPAGAGVGDFILMPSGNWYHIVVLSQLRTDGSYTISQANWSGNGDVSNVPGANIQSYLSGKSILRCN